MKKNIRNQMESLKKTRNQSVGFLTKLITEMHALFMEQTFINQVTRIWFMHSCQWSWRCIILQLLKWRYLTKIDLTLSWMMTLGFGHEGRNWRISLMLMCQQITRMESWFSFMITKLVLMAEFGLPAIPLVMCVLLSSALPRLATIRKQRKYWRRRQNSWKKQIISGNLKCMSES